MAYRTTSDRLKGLAQWAAWRTSDFTPVSRKETDEYWEKTLSTLVPREQLEVESGRAPLLLRSLGEEIIPLIEANYRTSAADRGLAGYSLRGAVRAVRPLSRSGSCSPALRGQSVDVG